MQKIKEYKYEYDVFGMIKGVIPVFEDAIEHVIDVATKPLRKGKKNNGTDIPHN